MASARSGNLDWDSLNAEQQRLSASSLTFGHFEAGL
jgi:hypothetical protein